MGCEWGRMSVVLERDVFGYDAVLRVAILLKFKITLFDLYACKSYSLIRNSVVTNV